MSKPKYPKPLIHGDTVAVVYMVLQDPQRHTGHCQITYTSRNLRGQLLTYCLQDEGERFGGVRLMRCSNDGEPRIQTQALRTYPDAYQVLR